MKAPLLNKDDERHGRLKLFWFSTIFALFIFGCVAGVDFFKHSGEVDVSMESTQPGPTQNEVQEEDVEEREVEYTTAEEAQQVLQEFLSDDKLWRLIFYDCPKGDTDDAEANIANILGGFKPADKTKEDMITYLGENLNGLTVDKEMGNQMRLGNGVIKQDIDVIVPTNPGVFIEVKNGLLLKDNQKEFKEAYMGQFRAVRTIAGVANHRMALGIDKLEQYALSEAQKDQLKKATKKNPGIKFVGFKYKASLK